MQIDKFTQCLSSGYFFGNGKTQGVSVDFRVCPLMREKEDGLFTPTVCSGCYSAILLNMRPGLRKKIKSLPKHSPEQLELFKKDCEATNLLFPEIKKLRFYALSDFGPEDMPYIQAASQFFTVDIISKTLTFPANLPSLIQLFDMPNVWVSLSFNKDWIKPLKKIVSLLKKHKPNNVQLNYMMNYHDENPDDPQYDVFQVLHFRNDFKRDAVTKFTKVPETRVCAIFDRTGRPVRAHGVCDKCDNCHVSFKSFTEGTCVPSPLV